ncbi:hypothetical protein CLV62_101357 [Dysgonomonas alginatilytica]|uniref:Outer membrane protein with beta-barrel domain n=1 Tax=Dysgonomonas alginatilytica TaxID=1605892 RepID=A0A2V3PWX2_9BACT|nr:hypothetical protein [Dysgonomonas alginatilytica]PXV69088.1 hypothetical protein CLV62_101357 [Dysgonomonas alginatilytica]
MKKALAVLGIFISSVSVCLAQEPDFKLGSYINPDFKRKELDFNLNSAGSFYRMSDSKNNYLSGDLGLRYDLVSNSEKEQAHTFGSFSGGAGSTSGESSNRRTASTGFSLTREAFQFFKKKTFLEISPKVAVSYLYSKEEEDHYYYNGSGLVAPYYRKDNNFSSNILLKLGIGKGRIEDVGDARQAMFILQELQKKNLLKRVLSNDEVNALTEQITLVKNKRYYDYRIQLIDEISTVDSFLVANDFVDKANSALYFTTIYDKWVYGDRDRRESGSYIKGGIVPEYSFNEDRQVHSFANGIYTGRYRNKNINSYYGAALYVDYRYEKPLTLALQSSFNAGLSSGIYKRRDYENNSSYRTNLNVNYTLGYYPNTRTYVSGGISQLLFWERVSSDYNGFAENKSDWITGITTLTATGYYFLSPQLRLFGRCDVSYREYNWYQGGNTHDSYPATSFQLGLSYAIF